MASDKNKFQFAVEFYKELVYNKTQDFLTFGGL